MKDFLKVNNWFDTKYAERSAFRYPTFKAALNLFLQFEGKTIVETGCVRLKDDWGAGNSTVMLADFCTKYEGRLWSVDITARNIQLSRELTKEFSDVITLEVNDSVAFLSNIKERTDGLSKIDLLYLDSFDYPYGELLDIYGGKVNLDKAIATLKSMSTEEIVDKHGHIIAASQEHCLKELMAALPYIHDHTPILIDDNDLPGGGKSRTARDWLAANGYTCILDLYQSLWIKRI